MIGPIIGDFCGSPYEGRPAPKNLTQLLSPACRWSDDTVLSVATAEALLDGRTDAAGFAEYYMSWGNRYPLAGYGPGFAGWLAVGDPTQRRASWGNGSGVRAGPIGWVASSLSECLALANESASVTHGHPDGIRGAQAVAGGVFLARHGQSDGEIKRWFTDTFGWAVPEWDISLANRGWDASCAGTLPLAFSAFFGAASFEDALLRACRFGGDADTIDAMAGALAEARFPVPSSLALPVLASLPKDMTAVVERFELRWPAVQARKDV